LKYQESDMLKRSISKVTLKLQKMK